VTADRLPLLQRFLRADILPRVAVALVGIPCLYVITHRGGIFFLLLVDVIILLGLTEFFRLMEAKGYRPSRLLGYAAALAVSVHAYLGGPALTLVVTLILLAIMVRELMRPQVDMALTNMAVTVLGVMYVGWLASHFVLLRELPGHLGADPGIGARLVFFAALVIWVCDTAAYAVGILVGGRKLLPRVSPAKTWSGSVGGVVGGGLAGWLCTLWFLPFVTPLSGVLLGVAAAVMGQLGDLVESLLKRDAGLKDTAAMLPGHGGILDRVDSLLFTVPLLYYWFRFAVL
jgi:phosphatidate cytidylyltransferase